MRRRLRDSHPLRCSVPGDFGYGPSIPCRQPHDPDRCPDRFRLFPVRSPLLRESRLICFPPGTEMFQFPGSPRAFRARRSLGSSPGLFAAFHARILMTPRHPPRALRSLTTPIGPPPVKAAMPVAAGPLGPGDGPAASRDAAPLFRVTISLSVRVHCCGEKDSATTTAWLSCLRD